MWNQVLVVVNDPSLRLTLESELANQAYNVTTARTLAEGRAALDGPFPGLIIEGPFWGLIITERNLPDGAGRRLRIPAPFCPIVIFTTCAKGQAKVNIGEFEVRKVRYIAKPPDEVQLRLSIQQLLRDWEASCRWEALQIWSTGQCSRIR
jgi:DNA-binding response OmpR family regulator